MNVVKKLQPRSWRTAAMHDHYESERAKVITDGNCPLCDAPSTHVFTHWRIVENIYPYDAVAHVHDLLLPIRHTTGERTLTIEEYEEYLSLKESWLNEHYTFVFEALPRNKSIPAHHHLHLIVPKILD